MIDEGNADPGSVQRFRRERRETLRQFFGEGKRPRAEHFQALVDSTLNMLDEGFDKTDEHGLKLVSAEKKSRLITFYRDSKPWVEIWRIGFEDQDAAQTRVERLHFSGGKKGEREAEPRPTLSLDPAGRVGVNNGRPTVALDVHGTIRARGRRGAAGKKSTVPADGKWHDITKILEGCYAFEVVAGVGGETGTGRYALLHAIAVNTFNPQGFVFRWLTRRSGIKTTQAYFRFFGDKLKLRWSVAPEESKESDKPSDQSRLEALRSRLADLLSRLGFFGPTSTKYVLQVRSNRDYGEIQGKEKRQIAYHLTELWSDHRMSKSAPSGAQASNVRQGAVAGAKGDGDSRQ